MLVTPAYAQAAGGANGMSSLLMFVPIIAIMYFLMIRPQQKRVKEHRAMVEALKKGDHVITQGGLIGKITSVRDDEIEVEIASGVKARVVRSSVSAVVNKTAPVAANS